MKYTVLQSDLIRGLSGFPIEVAAKMLENQVLQKNPLNIKVFQDKIIASNCNGGFTWCESPEGYDFWEKVIECRRFDIFFAKYPTSKEKVSPNSISSLLHKLVGIPYINRGYTYTSKYYYSIIVVKKVNKILDLFEIVYDNITLSTNKAKVEVQKVYKKSTVLREEEVLQFIRSLGTKSNYKKVNNLLTNFYRNHPI